MNPDDFYVISKRQGLYGVEVCLMLIDKEKTWKKMQRLSDRECLELSILKFEILKKHALEGSVITWEGIRTCPLCAKYISGDGRPYQIYCDKCPIEIHTGEHACRGTPYADLAILARNTRHCTILNGVTKPLVRVIEQEIKFLEKVKENA